MKSLAFFSFIFMIGYGVAQPVTVTEITTITEADGKESTQVEYKQIDANMHIDSFEEADKNKDGCLDKSEAYDMGIAHIFSKFAKTNPNCLTSEEYQRAIKSN